MNSLRDCLFSQLCARALDPISRPVCRGPIDWPAGQVGWWWFQCIILPGWNSGMSTCSGGSMGGVIFSGNAHLSPALDARWASRWSRWGGRRRWWWGKRCELWSTSSPSPLTMWRTPPSLSPSTTSPGGCLNHQSFQKLNTDWICSCKIWYGQCVLNLEKWYWDPPLPYSKNIFCLLSSFEKRVLTVTNKCDGIFPSSPP